MEMHGSASVRTVCQPAHAQQSTDNRHQQAHQRPLGSVAGVSGSGRRIECRMSRVRLHQGRHEEKRRGEGGRKKSGRFHAGKFGTGHNLGFFAVLKHAFLRGEMFAQHAVGQFSDGTVGRARAAGP